MWLLNIIFLFISNLCFADSDLSNYCVELFSKSTNENIKPSFSEITIQDLQIEELLKKLSGFTTTDQVFNFLLGSIYSPTSDEKAQMNILNRITNSWLTRDETHLLQRYSHQSYTWINNALRSHTEEEMNNLINNYKDPSYRDSILSLDRILERQEPLPTPFFLFRGFCSGFNDDDINKTGEKFTPRSFLSTSVVAAVGLFFSMSPNCIGSRIFDYIYIPENIETKGLNMKNISLASDEFEVLLPRNMNFEVIDFKSIPYKDKNFITRILKVIPDTKN